jgi:hypothetical protein
MRRLFTTIGASHRWKVAVLFGTAMVALGIAGLAYSTIGPNARLVHQDRLFGGAGTDPGCFVPDIGFCRKNPTDFAIDAHATGGDHAAYGDVVGRNGGRSEVTCLAVDGQNAVVGTRIVSSPDPSQVGVLQLTYYIDNGPGQLDQISPSYSNPDEPGLWPRGFPHRCPSPDVDTPEFGLIRSFIPISRANIVIQDGSAEPDR